MRLCVQALVLALVCASLLCGSVTCAKQPHILFVVGDDYGWNDVGYHGSEIPTPTLDKLAATGVKLENYYVQPVCTPSRCAFMTGRYPFRYGRQHSPIMAPQPTGLRLNETTLPQALKGLGYTTHAIGKWHLGFFQEAYVPIHRGFDTFYGYYLGEGDYFNHTRSISPPPMSGYDFRRQDQVDKTASGTYSSHLFAAEAERIVKSYDGKAPMFIYLAFQACHDPLMAPQEYKTRCDHIKDKDRRTFCAMAITMDEGIANVTRAFTQAGLWNDTIMIFTSDNGGLPSSSGNNFPLRGGKSTLWEGGVRAVSFVHSSRLKGGTTSRGLFHAVDWFPTIVNLASTKEHNTTAISAAPLDGANIWDSIANNAPSPHQEIILNIDHLSNVSAIRKGDWKLVYGKQPYDGWFQPPAAPEVSTANNVTNVWLFNVTADPTEHDDLSDKSPEVVVALLQTLKSYEKDMAAPDNPPYDAAADPAQFGGNWSPWKDNI